MLAFLTDFFGRGVPFSRETKGLTLEEIEEQAFNHKLYRVIRVRLSTYDTDFPCFLLNLVSKVYEMLIIHDPSYLLRVDLASSGQLPVV